MRASGERHRKPIYMACCFHSRPFRVSVTPVITRLGVTVRLAKPSCKAEKSVFLPLLKRLRSRARNSTPALNCGYTIGTSELFPRFVRSALERDVDVVVY